MSPSLPPTPPAQATLASLLQTCAEVRGAASATGDPRLKAQLVQSAVQLEQSATALEAACQQAPQQQQARREKSAQRAAANQQALAGLRTRLAAPAPQSPDAGAGAGTGTGELPLDPTLATRLRRELLGRFAPASHREDIIPPRHVLDGWPESG